MDGSQSAHHGVIIDSDVARERRDIRHYNGVAEHDVMSNVAIRQNMIVRTHNGSFSVGGGAMNCD